MTSSYAQLEFAAEFAVFLVATAGLVLSLRPGVLSDEAPARALLSAGFLAEAAAAFLHGSLLVKDFDQPALVVLRLVGIGLLLGASFRWRERGLARWLLWLSLVGLLLGELATLGGPERVADVARGLGGVLLGLAMVHASRHSIPARIGTIAAALVLVVVLAVSIALSLVIDHNVIDSAFARYRSRATTYAAAARAAADDQLQTARVFAGSLAGSQDVGGLLSRSQAGLDPGGRLVVTQALQRLGRYVGLRYPVLYVTGGGAPAAAAGAPLDNTTTLALAGSQVVTESLRAGGNGRQSTTVVGDRAFALAAAPVPVAGQASGAAGVVAVGRPLDDVYLQVEAEGAGEPLSLALADRSTVLARSEGAQPSVATVKKRAGAVVANGATSSGTVGSRFVVAQPVAGADGVPRMALVLSAPRSAIDHTRQELFRSLFLVALAVGLVALALAVFAGERIGRSVRRLTAAAVRIRGGDLSTRTGLTSPDEIGVLAETFDSMAGSLEQTTGDLRRSVADEARLRSRLQAVVAGMGEALIAVDSNRRITDFNGAAAELLGRPVDEAIGRPFGDVVSVIEGPRLALDGVPRTGEGMVRDAAGVEVPVYLSYGTLRDPDGSPTGAVVLLRDLRRERQIEQMKSEFLSNISHELRTPLTPIKGYAGMLARRDLPQERAAAFAAEISAGVDQLDRIINQLVHFATVAAGSLSLRREPVPARQLIDDLAARWSPRFDGHHRMSRRVAREVDALDVDRGYLDQSLDELVDNAMKYSPGGGRVLVSVSRTAPRGEPGAGVRLSVADEGIGIEPDQLAELLGDFSQGDSSSTRRFGGLGLGLALADQIVRAHDGWLECESEPGRGSRFSIILPDRAG